MISSNEKPLVTFALLAYNQEKFIQEAVRSAFSQDYRPLQIILSDDCSSDSTFDIMSREAKLVPNDVRLTLLRNIKNLGLGLHINRLVEQSKGHYIVMASGDDISESQRTSVSIAALENDKRGRLALHGRVTKISNTSKAFGVMDNPYLPVLEDPLQVVNKMAWLTGTTVVFRRELATGFPPLGERVVNEDMLWAFRSALKGGSIYINKPYVQYRVGVGISSFENPATMALENQNVKTQLQRTLAVLEQMKRDLEWISKEGSFNQQLSDRIGVLVKQAKLRLEFSEKQDMWRGIRLLVDFDGLIESSKIVLRFGFPAFYTTARKLKSHLMGQSN